MTSKFHPQNQRQIESYGHKLPQVLILGGLSSRARAAAVEIIVKLLPASTQRSSVDDEGALSINQVRELYKRLYLRPADENTLHLVHIIDAHRLTLPAQNALLKLLEEPPVHVKFILSTQRTDLLLPTIRSRSHSIELLPVDTEIFANSVSAEGDTGSLYMITGGDPWFASEIMNDEAVLNLKHISRQLLVEPLGTSLLRISSIAKDRSQTEIMLTLLARIAHLGLEKSLQQKPTEPNKWTKRLDSAVAALDNVALSTNPKLILDKVLLEFRHA